MLVVRGGTPVWNSLKETSLCSLWGDPILRLQTKSDLLSEPRWSICRSEPGSLTQRAPPTKQDELGLLRVPTEPASLGVHPVRPDVSGEGEGRNGGKGRLASLWDFRENTLFIILISLVYRS